MTGNEIQTGRFYHAIISQSPDNLIYIEEIDTSKETVPGWPTIKYRSDFDSFRSLQSGVVGIALPMISEKELKTYFTMVREAADFVEARFRESPLVDAAAEEIAKFAGDFVKREEAMKVAEENL